MESPVRTADDRPRVYRQLQPLITEALSDTRVVSIVGGAEGPIIEGFVVGELLRSTANLSCTGKSPAREERGPGFCSA